MFEFSLLLEKEAKLKKVLLKNSIWEFNTISVSIKNSFIEQNINVSIETDKILNELGKEGWELVAMSSVIAHSALSGGTTTTKFVYSFKRKL